MSDTSAAPVAAPAAARHGHGWAVLIPDLRVVVAIGYFALSWKLIDMIEVNPKLLAVSAFIGVASAVIGSGGLGLIAAFLFGGTKTGSEVMKAQSAAVIASSPPPVDPNKGPSQ